MKAYNICIISPENYIHSKCFREVAQLLHNSLLDLECDSKISANNLEKGRINIILGYHLANHEQLIGYDYIPYQLEQLPLNASMFGFSQNSHNILKNAVEVWDYSMNNIEFLKQYGITAKYLAIGYHKSLETIRQNDDKDIDVLFIGSVNERRKKIFEEILSKDLKLTAIFGKYGLERDEYISRAKILLNVHFYDAKIFESVRVSYLLNNNCFVLSEESNNYPYEKVKLSFESQDLLPEKCRLYIDNILDANRIARENYSDYKKFYAMTDLLSKMGL